MIQIFETPSYRDSDFETPPSHDPILGLHLIVIHS